MSFVIVQQRCSECHNEWQSSGGVVGGTEVGSVLTACPHCGSNQIVTIFSPVRSEKTQQISGEDQTESKEEQSMSDLGERLIEIAKEMHDDIEVAVTEFPNHDVLKNVIIVNRHYWEYIKSRLKDKE